MNIFELDRSYIANTYARFPINIVKGKGSLVWDCDGKEYIDLGSGIAVNSFGLCDEEWIAAVTEQLGKFQHTSNLYYSEPCAKLAQMLCERTGLKKVFFSNSGAEANESAIKAARKYAADKNGSDCYTIITLKNSFHGRTVTTLAATGQDSFHQYFQPLTHGFVHCEATVDDLRKTVNENKGKIAAIMFEIVRGEGGVLPLEKSFVDEMVKISREEDIILIADEVQVGNGRSGKLYGYMNYGFTPDVVTTAKGIGGGLPIGITMLGEKLKDVFTPGLNGSTFGGNPICCAGAISILQRIDDKLLEEVSKKSRYIFSELEGANGVESVTGMGLMVGVRTVKDAKAVVSECIANGVLVLTAKDKIRLLPALNIPFDLLEKAISILKKACV
ncbi:MAG TPA: aminotransferase class III-fold pyridoxal phosphate-dependent enzyme [Candidatus Faeciplasma pullistercoris]|uniref:Aminotransferase class III-fold pyridoxal phosphate-dependent enzyme n=1 Tax=Candidatus Faeciplasma pullistercoris TaxID=2840800 RepID=A0A9D1KKV2_9FIRM|nr:aminotransferase class III-fold pyridoxal phosphate-dependent enzyme [Candidatus Faeciplasma pullistercoris]